MSLFTDAELSTAIYHAWREASRCWNEYRKADDYKLRSILLENAISAEKHWRLLRDELAERREA